MKATKLILASALLTGLAAFAFAGPNPLFTNQQGQSRTELVQAQAQPASPVACAGCSCSCAGMKKS